jgi:predicted lipoprotein
MNVTSKILALFFLTFALGVGQLWTSEASAQSSYFTSRGCVNCHAAPTVATCAGCHQHSGTLAAATNKTTSYTPGETVTVTLTASGARSGWIGARLYNQSGAEIARSTGSQSGMGGSTIYPAVLSAPAPATAGTYTWRIAYLGNENGTGFGDVHSEKSVNVSITVASAADTTVPVVGVFTLPATATSLNVPVTTFTATDNVGVTGYLITTSATAPTSGWLASAQTSVTAVAGSNTFYAWARDAAGNVSLAKSASVTVTIPPAADTTVPVVGAFTLPTTATSLTVPVSSFTATDNVGVTGYLINKSATAPAATATGWTATAPTSVTAVAGSNTFYAYAKDAAGNVSLAKSASVTVTLPDTTVPVVSVFTLPATATSLNVPVTAFTATDNVGVTGYMITLSSTVPSATSTSWTASAQSNVTAAGSGTTTFYAWAKDAAGNVSLTKSASVSISLPDTAAPVVSAFSLPATATSLTVHRHG